MNKLDDPSNIQHLYKGWEESMLWSCFQKIMGEAYVDNIDQPQSALVYVNCFAFAAGQPDEKLVQDWYDEKVNGFVVITARDDSWHQIFEAAGRDKCRRVERYAIKKEKGCFDTKRLQAFVGQLSEEYELKRDLYPSWDAQNQWSVALAEKLGYHYSHTYTAYEMWKE